MRQGNIRRGPLARAFQLAAMMVVLAGVLAILSHAITANPERAFINNPGHLVGLP